MALNLNFPGGHNRIRNVLNQSNASGEEHCQVLAPDHPAFIPMLESPVSRNT